MFESLFLSIIIASVSATEQVDDRIENYSDFYPFYLTQHSKPTTKLFHFVGTSVTFGLIYYFLTSMRGKDR